MPFLFGGVNYGPVRTRFKIRQAGTIGDATFKRPRPLCEDDPDSRELLQFVFTSGGYDMVCAASGSEALQLAQQEQFDLFLVDNWMPALTGVELTRHIREFNQATPILFYSGAAHEAEKRAALKAGAQGYLTKPVDIDHLLDEVGRLIQESS